jgi:hypothetical protein
MWHHEEDTLSSSAPRLRLGRACILNFMLILEGMASAGSGCRATRSRSRPRSRNRSNTDPCGHTSNA